MLYTLFYNLSPIFPYLTVFGERLFMMLWNSAIPEYTALFVDPGDTDPDSLSKSEWVSTARQAQTKVKSVSMLWTEVISYQLV